MAKTFTAHIAIGAQNRGGILPTHVAWLFENSRPVWLLEPTRLRLTGDSSYDGRPGSMELIGWIPERPEHILEDGLLLIALHAFGEESIRHLASELIPGLVEMQSEERSDGLEYRCDLDEMSHDDPAVAEKLARLRKASAEQWPEDAKLAVTALAGSSVEHQLQILERYPTELEVCTSTYLRERVMGAWGRPSEPVAPIVRGSLEPPEAAGGGRYTEIRF
jgi:hypothetical protein